MDAALGDIGGEGSDPVDPLATVGEHIYQWCDVGVLFLDKRGNLLLLRQRLGRNSHQRQLLDAEAGFNLFGSVAEKLGQPGHVARRLGRSGPYRLDCVVDLVDDQIRPPRTEAALLKLGNELYHQPADIFVDGFGRTYRLLERS
ncbi:hypothetical protein D3C80_1467220 [compost metagenome]